MTAPVALVAVEAIKAGEFVRRRSCAAKTYRRGDYDRTSKRYALLDCDDASREIYVKRGTLLAVGFTY